MVGLIWFFFEKITIFKKKTISRRKQFYFTINNHHSNIIFNPTIKFHATINTTIKTPGKVNKFLNCILISR